MEEIPHHSELYEAFTKDPSVVEFKPPSNLKSTILTGSITYGRGQQLAMSMPPCSILRSDKEGVMAYSKLTLQLNRRNGKPDIDDERDTRYTDERAEFYKLATWLDEQLLAAVKKNPKAYFNRDIDPKDIYVTPSISTAEEEFYRDKLQCKVDAFNSKREQVPVNELKLSLHDVKKGEDGGLNLQPISLTDINNTDRVVPLIRGVYPYFEVKNNPRNKIPEGTCKIQWCLSGLHRVEVVRDRKRKLDAESSGVYVNRKTLNKYVFDNEASTLQNDYQTILAQE